MKIKQNYCVFYVHNIHILKITKRRWISMAHCPSCGKEAHKPSKELKNCSFTIQDYNCKKCHHNFKVTINQSMYIV